MSLPRFFNSLKRTDLALYWLLLAVGSITFSGVFAFLIAVARAPVLSLLFTDPGFFRKALVVHVDLGVSVWFTAFPVALFHLLNRNRPLELPAKLSLSFSFAGILILAMTSFAHEGEPLLSNYIPVISHPFFIFGLSLYFFGVALNYVSAGLFKATPENVAPETPFQEAIQVSQLGIRVGALYFLVSLATLIVSSLTIPPGFSGTSHYETLMWGGGHVLQFANISFMLVCWTLLLTSWTGKVPVTRAQCFFIFAWLGLPLLGIPWIAAQDITSQAHRNGFTLLMRWGIFPPVLTYLFLTLIPTIKQKLSFWDARPLGFLLSVLLISVGFIFGALVRGPDLRLPGHYHASIGAVTLTFMACALVLIREFKNEALDAVLKSKMAITQSFFMGFGQLMFAAGMFIAGSFGMARKVYGSEQQIRHTGQNIGMWIMGAGGIMALAGGVLFVIIVFTTGIFKRRRQSL